MKRKVKKNLAFLLALTLMVSMLGKDRLFVAAEEQTIETESAEETVTSSSDVVPEKEEQSEEESFLDESAEEDTAETDGVEKGTDIFADENDQESTDEVVTDKGSDPDETEEAESIEETTEVTEETAEATEGAEERIEETAEVTQEAAEAVKKETEDDAGYKGSEDDPWVAKTNGIVIKAYADKGVLPEDAVMKAEKVSENSEEYKKAQEAVKASGTKFDEMMALDISFNVENDEGQLIEIEPESESGRTVRVTMELPEAIPAEAEEDSLILSHITEKENGELEAVAVADNGNETGGTVDVVDTPSEDTQDIKVEFVTDGFSIFAVTWNNNIETLDETDGSTISWDALPNPSTGNAKNVVNFYINLRAKIANNSQENVDIKNKVFTTSVFATAVESYPENPFLYTLEGSISKWRAYIVKQGDSSGIAYDVDREIRKLGTEGLYGFKLKGFASDEDVFNEVRENWDAYTKADDSRISPDERGKIKVGNVTLTFENKGSLTTDNYAIRWYVFKYDISDAWHIDGIIVPRYGQLTVKKTFKNVDEELLSEIAENFAIHVSGTRTDGLEQSYKLNLKENENDGNLSVLGYDSYIYDENEKEAVYTWTFDVLNAEYTITEENGDVEGWDYKASYAAYPYGSAESKGNYPADGIKIDCVTNAVDEGTGTEQRAELINTYKKAGGPSEPEEEKENDPDPGDEPKEESSDPGDEPVEVSVPPAVVKTDETVVTVPSVPVPEPKPSQAGGSQTGDSAAPALWGVLVAISVFALTTILMKWKKNENTEE